MPNALSKAGNWVSGNFY